MKMKEKSREKNRKNEQQMLKTHSEMYKKKMKLIKNEVRKKAPRAKSESCGKKKVHRLYTHMYLYL